ncbi:MAG: hypothetical protein RIQ92_1149 [Actinomycetota bacterium]
MCRSSREITGLLVISLGCPRFHEVGTGPRDASLGPYLLKTVNQPTRSAHIARKAAVCASTSAAVVSGHINAML